jgi:proline iminopeptidase
MTRTQHLLIAALLAAAPACMDPGESGRLVPRTADEDPSLPSITIGDTTLHSETFGDPSAPMIVMLHGGPGGDYRYLLPLRELADDGYYVVYWDQRSAGLSQRHDASSFTMTGYLEDLRLVIEHYTTSSTQPIVFIGQSWGAMYATWFINEHGSYGGRLTGAVLTEPGAFTSAGLEAYFQRYFPPWGWTSEELNDLAWADQLMSPADHARADYLVQVGLLPGSPREHPDPERPMPLWRKGAIAGSALPAMAVRDGFDWTTNLAEYTRPVLFLRGDLNENMPLEHQQELASHYADARIITVPGVGHEGMWEQPDKYLVHIRAYLAELGVVP